MEYMAAQADAHMSAGQSLYERMEAELIELREVKAELLEACIAFLASDTADHNLIVGRDAAGSALNAAGVARIQMRAAIARATASTTDAGVAG